VPPSLRKPSVLKPKQYRKCAELIEQQEFDARFVRIILARHREVAAEWQRSTPAPPALIARED